MKKFVSFLIVFSLIFSVFTIFLPIQNCSAAGTTIYVDDSGGANYTTIQAAINAANDSDTVYVYAGTYSETILIDKSITLTGEGRSNTIISGSGDNTVKITADNVDISGFKIQNTDGSSYACIFLSSVTGCTISNVIAKYGGNSVYLVNSNSNTIQDSTIQNGNVGIYLSSSDTNTIKNNYIQNNNANGIKLNQFSNSNTIYLNHFSDNIQSNANDAAADNSWSYSSQGNYWDDYNDYDADGNEIGDSAYSIPGNGGAQDNYPLGDFLDEEPQAFINSISPDPATEGDAISFNGHSTDDGTILQWEWSSSIDGTFGSSEDLTYSGLSTGTHTIRFRVKDDSDQWSDYAQDSLVVNSDSGGTGATKPTASITKPSSTKTELQGNIVEFRGFGVASTGMILEYKWTSNLDGEISSLSSFTKTDLSVGTHTISFKVRDSNGWSDTQTVVVIIQEGANPQTNNAPTPSTGGPYTGKVGTSIVFDASGCTDEDGDEITSYQWSFGDGALGSGMTPSHTYSSAGTYTIVLTISDGTDTATDTTEAIISAENDDSNNVDNNDDSTDQNNDNNGDDSNNNDIDDNENNNTNDQNETTDDSEESPGFLLIFVIIAIILIAIIKKKYS